MITLVQAEFVNKKHCDDYVRLLNDYAIDVMGGGTALDSRVRDELANEIAKRDSISVFLAYENDNAVGLITCIEGFSTFQCSPLMNIHDVYVAPEFRGMGISITLLQSAEQWARKKSLRKHPGREPNEGNR